MDELPKRTQQVVYLGIEKEHLTRLLKTYGVQSECSDGESNRGGANRHGGKEGGGGGGGNCHSDGSADANADVLRAANVASTPHRVGLLKALALASPDSWLRIRLRALRRAAVVCDPSGDPANAGQETREPRMVSKLVLFAHHKHVMDLVQKTVCEELGCDGCVRIDGQSDGVAKNTLIDRFVADEAVQVALLSTTAAGVGVNGFQQVADTAVFIELPEDPRWKEQAEARLHRTGQKNMVTVIYLLADLLALSVRDMAAAEADLLRECEKADWKHWGRLHRNAARIGEVVSGDVQQSAAAAAVAEQARASSHDPHVPNGPNHGVCASRLERDPALCADATARAGACDEGDSLVFSVSALTRRVH
eukprot:2643475-Pleurochrysis_carterae.AAC.1